MIVRPVNLNSLTALIRNENIAVARISGRGTARNVRNTAKRVPVFGGINYRVEHNLESDVGRPKGATLMRDARVNWFMLPFPLSSTLVSP